MEYQWKTDRARWWRYCGAACLFILVSATLFFSVPPVHSDSDVSPTPTLDRLATPVVPDNPTPIDLGRQVYYVHCMPCHGDVGQGLTDEWRAVWVDDHQNCWAKGCHGGRVDDEGFPIPRTIPAVIGSQAGMAQHATEDELAAYLVQTHPPQRPGQLEKQEYEEVTAFLWHENGREPAATDQSAVMWVLGGGLLAILTGWLVYRARRMRKRHEA
jgi:mono/diheme cytochrome c family protein